jgi:ERCC4-type nuclease
MQLVIDYRETSLCSELTTRGSQYKTENLFLGDIQIKGPSGEVLLILERKALDDFASSHLSNRYREQRARLISERETNGTPIGYLIEGHWSANDKRVWGGHNEGRTVDEKMLRCLTFRLQLKYNIPVFQTASVADTAKFVHHLASILVEDAEYFKQTPEADQKQAHQATAYKERRKDNVLPAVSMLTGIHGVSVTKAEAILADVGSITDLCTKTKEEIAVIKAGATRLGPKLALSIWETLHANTKAIQKIEVPILLVKIETLNL